jgi:preprotein translocase subunit YajC
MSQLEKWTGIGFMLFVLGMGFMVWKSQDMRQECRIEVMKAGRSADDVLKICP